MSYKYRSEDGLAQSNNSTFIDSWNNIGKQYKAEEKEWIDKLNVIGIMASHPDDGWVDRTNNSVQFVYPHFNHGPKVGDKIALGNPSQYRVVKIKKVNKEGILSPHLQYYF